MQILEDEHERPLVGERLEEAPPGGERLVTPVAAALGPAGECDQGPQMRLDPRIPGRFAQLPPGHLIAVALEDAGLRLHHLPERPEADAVAVGQAPPVTPGGELAFLLDPVVQLEYQAALPDPRHADERHKLRRALLPHAVERPQQQLELTPTTNQRRPLHLLDRRARPRRQRQPDGNRLSLPFGLDRLGLGEVDRLLGRTEGLLADEDPSHRRRVLKPGRRVHDIARGHRLPLRRSSAQSDERLARIDPDPKLDPLLRGPVADRERSPHGPLRVVLV